MMRIVILSDTHGLVDGCQAGCCYNQLLLIVR